MKYYLHDQGDVQKRVCRQDDEGHLWQYRNGQWRALYWKDDRTDQIQYVFSKELHESYIEIPEEDIFLWMI